MAWPWVKRLRPAWTALLEIHGGAFPISFEIQARDDGDELFILGRATFTWDQLEIPRPTAQSVVSIEDRGARRDTAGGGTRVGKERMSRRARPAGVPE